MPLRNQFPNKDRWAANFARKVRRAIKRDRVFIHEGIHDIRPCYFTWEEAELVADHAHCDLLYNNVTGAVRFFEYM